ncbi:MAG: metallophosphoesterase [Acidobacteria bacterium]|nr:metallophosphoesterase [Acidobacteriota bacterium]
MSDLPQSPDALNSLLDQDAASLIANTDIAQYLENSEAQLLEAMYKSHIGNWPSPPAPSKQGSLMFGLVPYWINNPPAFITNYLETHKVFCWLWKGLETTVPTKLTPANYQALLNSTTNPNGGLIGPDGTIYTDSKYDQLDPEWLWAVMDYLIVTIGKVRGNFGGQPQIVSLSGSSASQLRIAIVGDWGTGTYADNPAMQVMNQINSLKPDYIIHLGDVYYAGTNEIFPPPGEESANYLELWPSTKTQAAGTSFMLNSNHEMYSGATGYFDALKDPRFQAQQNTSYFALKYGGWTLVGLDSAFYDTSPMFMDGSIEKGDSNQTQSKWLKGLGLDPSKTIIMTHHNGLAYDGSAETGLWAEINQSLGGDPAAWYWGHVHDGIAYKSPTVTGKNTIARCVGHGAFPYANAWGMDVPNPTLYEYYAHTPNPSQPPRVYNGFMMMTITSNGLITEQWYEQQNSNPVFTKTY